ncbi:glutathione transferase GstA [Paraburkholderia fungorum]|jgi:glutathione S-transferase|uniref:Glutathione transferase GstA n=1 Tax=Paraburkholderia fungorum TaxID=134537 RepID=A0AAP5QIH1_9BURK|nr:glutathione transferase GstA [Paraburkholderia fungorum]MBU7436232.1 glutathione transferase GstA [Paraburkholderia fungorum]MDT8843699.1 glutathione transferase GstA [Paraburkholderia fungorum]PZR45637.1 MAG: glutathione transferase GstA [Paraburkholderia fungorum]
MKLYYYPGACSLSPHIVLCESGLSFSAEKVDLESKRTESGGDFNAVNAKGYVPALVLDDGKVITEGPAIIQYIADLVPGKKLAPEAGSFERVQLQEWLNFLSSELHKSFSPLFNPNASSEWKHAAKEVLVRRFNYIAERLEGEQYLLGDTFSVADAYLFTILEWAKWAQFDLSAWQALGTYHERVAARTAVKKALIDEGLVNA